MPTASMVQSGPWLQTDYPAFGPSPVYYRGAATSYSRNWSAATLIRGNHKTPNPWSYNYTVLQTLKGLYVEMTGTKIVRTIEGQLPGAGTFCPVLVLTPEYNQCLNDAISKLTEKVRGSLDLATSLAESGQSAKMLNLVGRLTSGMADMKRSWKREILDQLKTFEKRRQAGAALRRWQKGVKARNPGSYRPQRPSPSQVGSLIGGTSKSLANGWCEYTYGWNPLLSDIHGIAQNIVGFVHNKCAVKAKATRSLDRKFTTSGSFVGWNGNVPGNLVGVISVEFGILLNPGFDNNLGRWSSMNPLSVAYELMPYSFVIDWVFDLGSYMRNLETSLLYGTSFKSGYQSTLTRYESTSAVRNQYTNGGNRYTLQAQGARVDCSFSRTVLTAYPTPSLPSFDVKLGASRLLSAAALLRQLLR